MAVTDSVPSALDHGIARLGRRIGARLLHNDHIAPQMALQGFGRFDHLTKSGVNRGLGRVV